MCTNLMCGMGSNFGDGGGGENYFRMLTSKLATFPSTSAQLFSLPTIVLNVLENDKSPRAKRPDY